MTVVDKGVGFDTDLLHNAKGLGLASIAERVALIGGSLKIASRPSGGTRLEIRAPLPASTVVARGNADSAPLKAESLTQSSHPGMADL